LPSWSAGPIRKEAALISVRSSSPIHGPYGKLIYAGRVSTGIDTAELERPWRHLPPLATDRILAGHVQLDHDPDNTFDRFATQR
jgi:ATP-dependent DNA ligase